QIEMLGSAEMVELAEAKLHGEDVSLDALKRILRPWLRMKEPPAFNLSHDQTLQFKSLMLKELNFVMNYVFTLETWYSFFVLR
ncbi:hypothetical protein MMT22_29660, partial [Escherichia coli]|nr:hypothetical protein [Escherichia coli]